MEYTLTLQAEHVRVILAALAEQAYKHVAPATNAILAQTDAQEKAAIAAAGQEPAKQIDPLIPPPPPVTCTTVTAQPALTQNQQ